MTSTTHASLVALQFHNCPHPFGVLLMGESGAGKSRLALELMQLGSAKAMALARVLLVADDQVQLTRENGRVLGRCPATIKGLLEVRGLGVVAVGAIDEVEIGLVVELVEQPPRLPSPSDCTTELEVAGEPLRLPLVRFAKAAPLPAAVVLAAYAVAHGEKLEDLQTSQACGTLF